MIGNVLHGIGPGPLVTLTGEVCPSWSGLADQGQIAHIMWMLLCEHEDFASFQVVKADQRQRFYGFLKAPRHCESVS
jgi:hypothetical protein